MPRWPELRSPHELEAEVLRFWKDARIFERSLEQTADGTPFVFYEGPPTANGIPHNGHVLTRVVKDLLPRYKTMRGFRVDRKAGWDTHGLPVEVEVEKELGIHGREEIEAYGVEPFSARCIESVFRYTSEWEELSTRIGFWADLDNAYVTYHRSYIESVWWALAELFNKGLLFQGHKVVWWWPQGGTALSAAEVGEGYRTVDDPAATVRFRLTAAARAELAARPGLAGAAAELSDLPVSLLAWTTTPWTLPSNVALAVNPAEDYALIRFAPKAGEGADGAGAGAGAEVLVVADARVGAVFGEASEQWARIVVVKGSELLGLAYAPLYRFDDHPPEGGPAWIVAGGSHVTLDAGTGIVHTAPAFGEDDFRAMKEQGLGFLQLIHPTGKFKEGCGWLTGRFCKEADKDICRDLKDRGLMFRQEVCRHEYPFCPRADQDPLIQYARPAWFIRTTSFKDQALANNERVDWHPETIKHGRFGDFLRNNVDWALSRERYWGTPLNIWGCTACGHRHAPASCAEITAMGGQFAEGVNPHLQVHKPWIDRVRLDCPGCGAAQAMQRVSEVIDCWFDSGCMPFAQWGFPHQNVDTFRRSFPADFISEAIDQTRGWFYSLLMISTLVFDAPTRARYGLDERLSGSTGEEFPRPYRSCIVLGHVCDADGKKESKSKGNYTSPDLVLKGWMKVGVRADAGLKRGQVGFKPPQVKSLSLNPDERMRIKAEGGTLSLEVVARDVKGKDVVALHPDDIAEYGLGASVVMYPPFAPPGADAFRWLFYSSGPPWVNTRISLRAILEGQREFLIRLKNVHQFFVLNAPEHVPAPIPDGPAGGRHSLDRWALHALTALTASVTAHMEGYRIYEAARALNGFVDDLSNWWLRRSRDRFDSADPAEAAAVRDTLYHVLLTLSALIAPFVPFQAEAMYRSLRAGAPADPAGAASPESVHLCRWPEARAGWLDAELDAQMRLVQELASLGLSARAAVGVRVRQPLSAVELILAQPERGEELARLPGLIALLKEELNVREVRFSRQPEDFVNFKVKPDFKVLGKKLGKDMKSCQQALAGMDGAAVRAAVLGGGLALDLPGGRYVLGPEEIVVAVEPKAGFQASGSAVAVVVLHATLSEDLLEEGLSREIVSRVQGLRKQAGLRYEDSARVAVEGGGRTARALSRFQADIERATGCRIVAAGDLAAGDPAAGDPAAGDPAVSEGVSDGESLRVLLARG